MKTNSQEKTADAEEHDHNPLGRFCGLADIYAKWRPSYPADALDFIIKHCSLNSRDTMADIGCGTGISTRLFAQRGLKLLGIEPNDDMRQKAQAHDNSAFVCKPQYIKATAEETTLDDGSVQAVLCAQSFHWFKKELCLKEFERILKVSGYVVLMWNERDESDAFTKSYGDKLREWPETNSVEVPRREAGKALLESSIFSSKERYNFYNEQSIDEEGLLGRAFSASYAPLEEDVRKNAEKELRTVFREYQKDGIVVLRYETSVYVGCKKADTKN